jgi:hypothetical protein
MTERSRDAGKLAAVKEGMQPDPMLNTTGAMHPAWLSALGLAIVIILAVVFYGLNEPVTSSEQTASSASPPAAASGPNPTPSVPAPGNPAPAKEGKG